MSASDAAGKEAGKKAAAVAAVNEHVSDRMVVGVGSGSTVVYAVERLAERVREEKLSLVCVPTSFQSEQLIVEHGLVLGDLSRNPVIDVDIDGADEVDPALNAIKGGGGAHLREKIVASCSKKFVIVADSSKVSEQLGTVWRKGVPIEVSPMAYVPVTRRIKSALKGDAVLRMAKCKAGPVVTDNGNFILDADFGAIDDVGDLEKQLLLIPGIVEVGLFVNMAEVAYFGQPDGTVSVCNGK